MKKRILAAILSMAMLFSSVSVYAEAEHSENVVESADESNEKVIEADFKEGTVIAETVVEEYAETEERYLFNEIVNEVPIEEYDSPEENDLAVLADDNSQEITVGETIQLDQPTADKEYQVNFRVPETKRYRIYFVDSDHYNPYKDSITVYNRYNEIIQASDDESWYLTRGDTVSIHVKCDQYYTYRESFLSLRLIEYVGIDSVSGSFPEYLVPGETYSVDVQLRYTNGNTKNLLITNEGGYLVPVREPVLEKYVVMDCEWDTNVINCTINNKTTSLGQLSYIPRRDPRVYQICEPGLYTVKRQDLFNSHCFVFRPMSRGNSIDHYTITVSGNSSNDIMMYATSEEKGTSRAEKTDKGAILRLPTSGIEASLMEIHDDTANSEYTVRIERAVSPVSVNIESDYTVNKNNDGISVSANILIVYEDGSQERVPVTLVPDDWKIISSKKGYEYSVSLSNGFNTPGIYSLSVHVLGFSDDKEIILFPDNKSIENCDATLSLNENVKYISIPALKTNECYLARINSLVDRTYYLNASDAPMFFSVFEENNKELVHCFTKIDNSNYSDRIHFEKGKTYYLFCESWGNYDEEAIPAFVIKLEGFYSGAELLNTSANITSIKDLESVQIYLKHSLGEDLYLPLLVNNDLNRDSNLSYYVMEDDNERGYWWYSTASESDILNYLRTGDMNNLVAGYSYRLMINWDKFRLYLEISTKSDEPEFSGIVTLNFDLPGSAKIDVLQGEKLVQSVANAKTGYTISSLAPDNYIIRLSADGYITKEVPVIVGSQPVTVDVNLWKIQDAAALCEASLSLEGQIGVNLIVNISEVMLKDSGAYAELTQEGSSNLPIKVKLSDAAAGSASGDHVFTYPVAAKEINDKITIRIYSGSGEQLPLRGKMDRSVELSGNKFSYAATDYINSKKNSSTAIGSLMKALNDYGVAAETYFQYGNMGTAGILADLSTVNQTVLSPYKAVGSGDRLNGVSVSASLMLESMTSINVTYAITGSVSDFTFTCDGKKVTPVTVGNEYQVTVADIAAKDLDKMHEFSITDKSGKVQTVKYSALSYAYSKVNNTGDVGTVAKTLYLYNQAAKGYFGV